MIPFLKHNLLYHQINSILASLVQPRLLPQVLRFRKNKLSVVVKKGELFKYLFVICSQKNVKKLKAKRRRVFYLLLGSQKRLQLASSFLDTLLFCTKKDSIYLSYQVYFTCVYLLTMSLCQMISTLPECIPILSCNRCCGKCFISKFV